MSSSNDTFTATYTLYQDAISRYCTWKCGDRDTGEDLMQQAFLNFWNCLEHQQDILNTRAFLYRIAHNLMINHVRRKKETSLDVLLESGFEPSFNPWHQTYSRLESEKWFKKLEALPVQYRQVLRQRFIDGLLPAEIGAILGETANTISVRIYRGIEQLKREVSF